MFWGRVLRAGAIPLNTLAGWAGTIILIAGAAAGIVVPVVSHISSWLTAVVLLGVLVAVVAEGAYRVWHETNQNRATAVIERDAARAEIERQQSEEQRAASARQVEVLELQAQELRASREQREREAESAREQREREAAEKQRTQATQVLIWEERLGYDPRTTQAQRADNPGSSTPTITAYVKNNSEQPIYDVVISWHRGTARWGESDLLASLMPGAESKSTRPVPELPDYVNPAVWGAVVFFRDAAGTYWRRRPDGQPDELSPEQVPRN